jgi:hypothetical protein
MLLPPGNIKVKIYETIILPLVLYVFETWSLTLRAELRLTVYEERVLEENIGPLRDELKRGWKKL